jgi:hypothetical protein
VNDGKNNGNYTFYMHVPNLTLIMLGTTMGSTCGTFPHPMNLG